MSKKIALFLTSVGRGGVGRNMISLAHGLQQKGCEVELLIGSLNANSFVLAQGILDALGQTVPFDLMKLKEKIIKKFTADYVLQQHLDLIM